MNDLQQDALDLINRDFEDAAQDDREFAEFVLDSTDVGVGDIEAGEEEMHELEMAFRKRGG